MSNSKKQSIMVIGLAMIIIAAIMLFFALSQPKQSLEEYASSTDSTVNQSSSEISSNNGSTGVSYSEPVSFPVNINTCTFEELLCVEGVGETKASAIIEYRDSIGEYTSLEQIKDISGIGEGVYERIAPYLCV